MLRHYAIQPKFKKIKIRHHKREKYRLLRPTLTVLFIMTMAVMNFGYVYGDDMKNRVFFP